MTVMMTHLQETRTTLRDELLPSCTRLSNHFREDERINRDARDGDRSEDACFDKDASRKNGVLIQKGRNIEYAVRNG